MGTYGTKNNDLHLLLAQLPSLLYLNLDFSTSGFNWKYDGSLWEHFIRTKLPLLQKLEFIFHYRQWREGDKYSLDSFTNHFRTLFWLEEKRRFVTCKYIITSPQSMRVSTSRFTAKFRILMKCAISARSNMNCSNIHGKHEMIDAMKKKTLTILNLRENNISDEGIQYLADSLQDNTTLIEIFLGSNLIGPRGAQYLANALRSNAALIVLDLWDNQIASEGIHHLANALQNNTTITELYVGRNEIKDEGAIHMANLLRNNTTLIILDLCDNAIRALGAQHLADALQNTDYILLTRQSDWKCKSSVFD
ncbi:unnamed protein product [Adineta steineri]|uniref:Uncharacterized protein n=1 Tax=Adineta steineri TaxID=433720 RepID=A0A815JHR8_9BILA|nr:unnamed protein product [Adineta steineri]CAF3973662.1 unnamed protein product [Adineta steineri]